MKYLKEDPTGYNNQDPYAKTKGFHNGNNHRLLFASKNANVKFEILKPQFGFGSPIGYRQSESISKQCLYKFLYLFLQSFPE